MTTVIDRFRLDGKVAIVTGSSSGLGVAMARALAEAGADLVLAARRAERLEGTRSLVEQAGGRAITVPADIAQPEHADAVVAAATREFGHVDVLVNNAGKGTAVPATRETPAQFREVIDVNLNGCYWMAQACGRVMPPGSAIINVASVAALTSGGLPQAARSHGSSRRPGRTRRRRRLPRQPGRRLHHLNYPGRRRRPDRVLAPLNRAGQPRSRLSSARA